MNAPVLPPTTPAPNPVDADLEEHEHEYIHSYFPLETRELTANEELFITRSRESDTEGCLSLLNSGLVDIDVQDQWGSTALMHAANKCNYVLVTALLKRGANIDKQDYVS
jgi:ankyrin repeat protein